MLQNSTCDNVSSRNNHNKQFDLIETQNNCNLYWCYSTTKLLNDDVTSHKMHKLFMTSPNVKNSVVWPSNYLEIFENISSNKTFSFLDLEGHLCYPLCRLYSSPISYRSKSKSKQQLLLSLYLINSVVN